MVSSTRKEINSTKKVQLILSLTLVKEIQMYLIVDKRLPQSLQIEGTIMVPSNYKSDYRSQKKPRSNETRIEEILKEGEKKSQNTSLCWIVNISKEDHSDRTSTVTFSKINL